MDVVILGRHGNGAAKYNRSHKIERIQVCSSILLTLLSLCSQFLPQITAITQTGAKKHAKCQQCLIAANPIHYTFAIFDTANILLQAKIKNRPVTGAVYKSKISDYWVSPMAS